MRIPKPGEILANAAGQKWVVEAVRTADDFADDLDEDEALSPGYFQIDLVEGTDPDDIDAVGLEHDDTSFAQFLKENSITL
ncbi:hypothetical protein [Acidovorax sp. LjRoot194]|uniref:hypothetical protein n=1 Tax=Acidovorax sp. LjRoot194 TaxID=3342280 RepID=UPI003ECF3D9A